MSATTASNPAHVQGSDDYYSDDAPIFQNSPVLRPLNFKLEPLSTQPVTSTHFTVSPESSPGTPKSNGPRMKVAPSLGDAVLVGALDGNRHPEIAAKAGEQPLPGEGDIDEEQILDLSESPRRDSGTLRIHQRGGGLRGGGQVGTPGGTETEEMAVDPPEQADMGAFNLKSLESLAASALQQVTVATADPTPESIDAGPSPPPPPPPEPVVVKEKHIPPPLSQPIAIRRGETPKGEWPPQSTGSGRSPYSPRRLYSPPSTAPLPPIGMGSPDTLPPSGGLPPIQFHSPRSDTNGQTPLPSIRDQLGDALDRDQPPGGENGRLHDGRLSFGHSPPGNMPRLPSMAHPGSPPISPADYRGQLSPGQPYQQVTSPGYYPPYHQENGLHRSPHHYQSSTTVTPGSDQSSTTAASINEKMSIEGLTIQSAVYICKFQGCTAAPFQTQYLLNSHANVHSSARPHYCPVAGCPRSEGGKGFKRKNEMIRHGLVHDSPGYVCPFCPDREHKYPRPDNLQRHVRVHHVDKDKDDPLLRDVLAQRPDGPNKGRRRRGLGA